MREILFKAKRKDNGEWVEGNLLIFPDGDTYICFADDEDKILFELSKCQVDLETVCQYTGLNDKNGKKIFEGDILLIIGSVTLKVLYEQGLFVTYGAKEPFVFEPHTLCSWRTELIEVISNIFDNPELLEV